MAEKVIFLDRDGVINKDEGQYITSWPEFEFLPGALEAIKKLTKSGFKLIVISNQAGVSKGLYTQEVLADITYNMQEKVRKAGGNISAVHYCMHRQDAGCECRKPKTGLFKQALKNSPNINTAESFMIGDSEKDIEAGKKAGCKTILVLTGKAKKKEDVCSFKTRPDFISNDLLDAVDSIILKRKK